jgi:hypothetical protein
VAEAIRVLIQPCARPSASSGAKPETRARAPMWVAAKERAWRAWKAKVQASEVVSARLSQRAPAATAPSS